jgi:sporulation protein YqfC
MSKKIRLGKKRASAKIDFLGKTVDFPSDPLGRSAHITLIADKEAVIDGCYGIIEYSEMLIKINIGNRILVITGVDFDISDYSATSLTVRGTIKSLEYC